ncbi:hypothetical protein ACFLWA_07960 [Chloroflexota bacterium]
MIRIPGSIAPFNREPKSDDMRQPVVTSQMSHDLSRQATGSGKRADEQVMEASQAVTEDRPLQDEATGQMPEAGGSEPV